jgi:hypothetical protein
MKVVFLDIDGVLNSERFLAVHPEKIFPRDYIDREAVKELNRIVHTGARFVLSSSWRIAHRVDQVQRMLDEVGFEGQIVDRTPLLGRQAPETRGLEIRQWLDENPLPQVFVALDDFYVSEVPAIRVDPQVGLTYADVSRAIEMLL